VGGSGLILKTTNGGSTWTEQISNTTVGLFYVRFTDANNGWIVGQSGTILHTTNSGVTWTTRQQGAFVTHNAVDFPDANHGWMVGDGGLIRATADGGQNWTFQNGGTGAILFGVRFIDNLNGWAVGQGGVIVHTSDGGQNWSFQTSGYEGTTTNFLGVDFLDAQHGCVVGTGGKVLYTGDGGTTWEQMLVPVLTTLTSVDFVDATTIYAAGHFGTILVCFDADQGASGNWEPQNVPFGDNIHRIRMLDANTGWTVGQNGQVLHTVDGGAIWDEQRREQGRDLYGGDFRAIPLATPEGQPQRYKYVGWACGEGGRMVRLVTTNDPGATATWTRVDIGTVNTLRAIHYTDPDLAWVVGTFGTVQRLN
jgi:photosystem II stability/assembly factor-like uncharacterized protein